MKRASWNKTQPVGNSDKLEKKAMSFSEKEKPFDLMMSTLYILLKAADWITVSRFLRDQKQQKDFNFVFSAILRV